MLSRILAALLTLSFGVLAACGATSDTDEPAAEPTPAVDIEDAPVQDVWVYERVQTATGEGELVDLTDQLLDGLDVDQDAAVELIAGATFTPVDQLKARILDENGEPRDDLEVVAGVISAETGSALQVVATPTGDRSVGAEDRILLDLPGLSDYADAPLIVDFAFGQGIPTTDEPTDADALDLLAFRMGAASFNWYGLDDAAPADGDSDTATGDTSGEAPSTDANTEADPEAGTEATGDGPEVGLLRVFGTLPGASDGGMSLTPSATRSGNDADVVTAALSYPAAATVMPVANGGGGDGIPAKARPTTDSLTKLGCRGAPIKCISEYFKEMRKGFQESLDRLFRRNMPPNPTPPPPPCYGCGGSSGEPHINTFDGATYDMQLQGEFVAAKTDDFELQLRTTPWRTSDSVSVNTAAAIGFGEHRISVERDRDPLVMIDGEGVTREALEDSIKVGSATVGIFGPWMVVDLGQGREVAISGFDSQYMNVRVNPGEAAGTWAGLFGDRDGDPENDLEVPADRAAAEPLASHLQEHPEYQFAHAWRISEDESLFDRADGKTTESYTDMNFPYALMTVEDLPEDVRAAATALCEQAGIASTFWLRACILDFGLTGDLSFITASQEANVLMDAPAAPWLQVLDVTRLEDDIIADDAGHVLVPASSDAGATIVALDALDGQVAWQVEVDNARCAVTVPDMLVAWADAGEGSQLVTYATSDGKPGQTVDISVDSCSIMASTAELIALRDGDRVYGFSADEFAPMFEHAFDAGIVAGPAIAGDGAVWVVASPVDSAQEAIRIDADGNATRISLPDEYHAAGSLAATADGVVLGTTGTAGGTGMLRLNAAGTSWHSTFPIQIGDTEYTIGTRSRIHTNAEVASWYADGERVAVADLETGELAELIQPSSFENNDAQHFLTDEVVVTGPFGGDAWVEAYRTDGSGLAWTASGWPGLHDAKAFGPALDDGGVIVSSTFKEGGIAVAKVGPGAR